jgi:hypothetical protein
LYKAAFFAGCLASSLLAITSAMPS